MSFWQFLTILKARWKIALAVLLSIVTATVVASLLLPKKYTATASVVIDLKSPDPITGMMMQGMLGPSIMATQMDVITSPRTAKRVIDGLKLANNPELQGQWQEATEGKGALNDWLAGLLIKQLDVKPSRESNVMAISYSSPSPEFAQALANAFAQAYVDTTLSLRVQPAKEVNRFFEVQATQARETLEAAQSKLSKFQQEKGLLVTDERLDVENTRLNELTGQLVGIKGLATESTSRQSQAARNGAAMQEVTSSPLINGLKSQLSGQSSRLRELLQKYGDAHPQVGELKASIKELNERIQAETRTLTSGVQVQDTINKQRVRQIELDLAAQRAKVLRMKEDRDAAAVLQRDVENAQRAYDAVVNRSNQTNLESQSQLSNVSVLNPAPLPIDPASPRPFLNTLLAVFVGTLLAVATALLMELLDRRLRSPQDVVEIAGISVVGTLPKPGKRRLRQAKRGVLLAPAARGLGQGPTAALPAPGSVA